IKIKTLVKVFSNDQSEWVEIFPDLLKYIAEQENWKLQFVSGTWEEGLSRLSGNQIDISFLSGTMYFIIILPQNF
ncbi:MAG: hypothetical protein ACTSUK_05775, partial [Promethearchaeota archaeon]